MHNRSQKTALVWFRYNLRTTDCEALYSATREAEMVIPFYCFDNHYHKTMFTGWPKTGAIRTRFLLEALEELRKGLQQLGSDLYLTKGCTSEEIFKIHKQHPISCIYLPTYPTAEEMEIEQRVAQLGIPMKRFHEHTLLRPGDLPFSIEKVPHIFTNFRKTVEKSLHILSPLPSPDFLSTPEEFLSHPHPAPSLEHFGFEPVIDDPRSAFPFRGGEQQAAFRLNHYLFESGRVSQYKETRNGLIGTEYSSKLSAYLAMGCISARTIYAQLKSYENQQGANESTYWLFFELLWRDFFHFTAMKLGNRFFKIPKNHRPKTIRQFEQWRLGNTGEPFVDANMKELLLTGYMSNRGRQNVASYLVHNLRQEWYLGALWFESQLIDYDPCSNYGNWTYVAGIGNDPRNRSFNIRRQAEMYDPDGSYQKLWDT